jgi:hypothetical protein
MTLVNFTNLDFDQIKVSLKEYLRSNSNFTDYDFEGSNLSTIIDLLAYNTYISSYNANMVSNEVFIDSATLRENVVSLARNIGYVPRSRTSAKANISFFVDTSTFSTIPLTLTLKKGTVCLSSSTFGDTNFSFAIKNDITVPVVNGIALFDGIDVHEGSLLTANFTVNSNNPNQKFILENSNIDTSTISVIVRNTESSSVTRNFAFSDSILNVTSDSRVFFIQEIEDQRYELIFGDGVFGKKLDNLNYIDVSYVITGGESGNGVSDFTFAGRLVDNNGRVVTDGISLVTTNVASRSGKEIESVESIKKYAPRIYASQNRAVTASDYESIIPKIYPETESISVYGGEDLNPPRYGRVFISIKPFNGPFVSSQVKDNIVKLLRKYSVAGIVPEIVDLKYLYVEFDSTIYFNSNLVSSGDAVRTTVSQNITKYADSSELNRYGARFKYSKFLKIIDDSNNSITSNITKIRMRRDLFPLINQFADYEICFGNQFHIKDRNGFNIKSSGFKVNGLSETLYMTDVPDSNLRTGRIIFFRLASQTEVVTVATNAGTINYEKGEILLSPVDFRETIKSKAENPVIEISAVPKSNDVIGLQDLYLQIDINNSTLNAVSDEISSGADISGTSYTVTSSYENGNLVRS